MAERGLQALKAYACRRCHRSGGTGNRLAADLDRSAQQSTPEELAAAIRHPVLFMPDFRFAEARIVDLVNALLAGSRAVEPPLGEAPLVIHFEEEGQGEQNAFVKHCGGCHRLLTEKRGGLDTGSIAPTSAACSPSTTCPTTASRASAGTPSAWRSGSRTPGRSSPVADGAGCAQGA